MDVSRSQHVASVKGTPAVLPQELNLHRMQPSLASDNFSAPKASGYGLPCAKCRLYYSADLDTCPTCRSSERVSAIVSTSTCKVTSPEPELMPDLAVLEQEREAFLRQFKSELFAARAEVVSGPPPSCMLGHHPADEPEIAEVCKQCYDLLQERLDVCEAALHIDLNEAAQIIYDAVWADPSDPSKTYTNAATALLTELRKRAGISSLLGPFQTLSH